MTAAPAIALLVLVVATGAGCRLPRPDVAPVQMLEPEIAPAAVTAVTRADAVALRLLDTGRLSHVGRRVLYQQPAGVLIADPTWRWASPPDRYLELATRLEAGRRGEIALVDAVHVPTVALSLLAWHLADGSTRIRGVVEVTVTTRNRAVHTFLIRAEEPVGDDVYATLGAASGRLLATLAAQSLDRAVSALQ